MTIRATPDISGHCTRCDRGVRTVQPWPHWRRVRYGYFATLLLALFCAPVILADGFVLIPMLMIFIASIGPLNAFVRKPITCADCGAPIENSAHSLQVKSA